MIEAGNILCLRTTGELVVVLGSNVQEDRAYHVRRPLMTHEAGISHSTDVFFDFELETVEDHLRREAKELILKVQIQDEMTAELEKSKGDKKASLLVN